MVRRGCTWDHLKRGHLDWPEELAEPVYNDFSKQWRDLFGTILPQQVNQVKSDLQRALTSLHNGIQQDIVQQGCRHQSEVVALQQGLDFSSSVSYCSLAHLAFESSTFRFGSDARESEAAQHGRQWHCPAAGGSILVGRIFAMRRLELRYAEGSHQ